MTSTQWATKSALSILDQGLISGTNFLISILYARWLTPVQYGDFAILFAVFLFLSGFHNALIIEPMSILGPSRSDFTRPGYMPSILVLHAVITTPLALILALASLLIPILGSGVLALGVAFPVILLFWLLRRACYLAARPDRAVRASLVYAVTSLVCLVATRSWASPAVGFLIMALASAFASAVLVIPNGLSGMPHEWRSLLRQHWTYGRWVLGTSLLYWTTGTFFTPIVGATAGLAKAAIFRSAENSLLPLGQIVTASSLLVLPWASREYNERGAAWLRAVTWRTSGFAFLLACAYSSALLFAAPALFRLVYANQTYAAAIPVLFILSMAAVVRAVSDFGVSLSLKAAAHSRPLFWSTLFSAAVSMTLGLWLIREEGVIGAAWATLAASLTQALVLFWFFFYGSKSTASELVRHQIVAVESFEDA